MKMKVFSTLFLAAVTIHGSQHLLALSQTDLLPQALKKMSEENYVGALADLDRIVEQAEPPAVAYFQMGVCQSVLGQYAESVKSFRRAEEQGIEGWELWSAYGVAYYYLARNSRSREYFERVLKLNEEELSAPYYLGRIDMREKQYAEAEQRFRLVLKKDPNHTGALFNLGHSLIRQGKRQEGKRVLQYHQEKEHLGDRLKTLKDMATAPQPAAGTYAEMGNVYVDLGSPEEALKAFERAEKLDPDTALTSLGRGKLAYYKRDLAEAETHLRRHLKEVEKSCEGYQYLGLVLKAEKKTSEAHQMLQKAVGLCPQTVVLLSNLGEIEIQVGRIDQARQLSEKIMALDPAAPSGPFLAAVSRLYRRDLDGAEKWALKANQLAPEDPEYHRLLAAIYRGKGNREKAQEHGQKMQDLIKQGWMTKSSSEDDRDSR